jgi:hypothetical protein
MPFAEVDKVENPGLRVYEPIWDSPSLSDAQKAEALVGIGFEIGRVALVTEKFMKPNGFLDRILGRARKPEEAIRMAIEECAKGVDSSLQKKGVSSDVSAKVKAGFIADCLRHFTPAMRR